MARCRRWAAALAGTVAVAVATLCSAVEPPQAPAAVDTYFGTTLTDPWRHLERTTDPAVVEWMQGEGAATRNVLDSMPGREALIARMREIDAGAPARVFSVERLPGEKYRYLKRTANDNSLRLYRREGGKGRERVLVDLEPWVELSGGLVSFSYFSSSPFGNRLAYGLAQGGSDATTLRVSDVRTGRDLVAPIDRTDLDSGDPGDNGIGWLPDESGFFYNRLSEHALDPAHPDRLRWSQVYLRRIGQPDSVVKPVFGSESSSGVAMQAADMPLVFVPPDEKHAIALVIHGTQREFSAWIARLDDVLKQRAHWTKLFGPDDKITGMSMSGSTLYLLTHKDAPRYRIVKTSLDRPDVASVSVAPTLFAPERGIVVATASTKDALYVKFRDAMTPRLMRFAHGSTRAEEIALPDKGAFEFISSDSRIVGVLIRIEAWNRGYQFFRYDPRSRRWANDGLQPRGTYDAPRDIEFVETEARSHDGASVPLSIVHRKGIALDGQNPTLLTGYGAYGAIDEPNFEPATLAWFEQGGVSATCHVRGGGVHGRAWYDAGRGATKANTWKDAIACAEWLVAHGYASPSTLAIFGGSAGGIFAGRAIIERPDLFVAAVIQNGALDMIRSETMATGAQNIPEFGSTATREGFDALLAMSTYRQVKEGVRYPATLFIHGVNDSRVEVWHSLKTVARMRAVAAPVSSVAAAGIPTLSPPTPAKWDSNPVMLRLDFDAGHGSGSTRDQHWQELADMWSFVLWRSGRPAFQPEPGEPRAAVAAARGSSN